jgi:hypothetical protein
MLVANGRLALDKTANAVKPVEVSTQESAVRVVAAGEPHLTLKQKLARFDPERHGGEAMPARHIGNKALRRSLSRARC